MAFCCEGKWFASTAGLLEDIYTTIIEELDDREREGKRCWMGDAFVYMSAVSAW